MKLVKIDEFAFDIQPIVSDTSTQSIYAHAGKRLLDLILALLILPVVAPMIAALALLVMRDGGKPFFGHVRIGQDGKPFKCYKIRSMVPNAEAQLAAYLDANPEEKKIWMSEFKLKNDPRVTAIGDFIRKASLDELPQIWNVLCGQMSFVGPRPVPRVELEQYGQYVVFYQAVRPGITGLWQVSGRNDVSYDERIDMDREYVFSLSLWSDIKILCRTVPAIMNKTGV